MNYILQMTAAVITLVFGILAFIQPKKYAQYLSIVPDNKAGVTEIRTNFGGLIIGLSGFVLYNQSMIAFQVLGFGWLGVAIARGISMFLLDHSYSRLGLSFLIIDFVVSAMLLL